MAESSDGVQVVTAEGVKEEIAELTATSEDDDSPRREEIDALKRRIAELFLECEGNPYADGGLCESARQPMQDGFGLGSQRDGRDADRQRP